MSSTRPMPSGKLGPSLPARRSTGCAPSAAASAGGGASISAATPHSATSSTKATTSRLNQEENSMTNEELREHMDTIGWSTRTFSYALNGGDRSGIREMLLGEAPIPQDVADWVERLARFHAANPPPAFTWKKN